MRRGGGAAARGGGCYHLSFRSGSRAGGACAGAAYAYITRTEEYDDPERDDVVYTESDHLPAWAKDDPHEYWDAADLYERANGRLYVSADFALSRDLDANDQVALARAFAQELTDTERLPYTLAIHAGQNADGHEHNPHAHVMISERQNDGIPRSKEQWFRRLNRGHPERGGAPKAGRFTAANGWSTRASGGLNSPMKPSNDTGDPSASTIAAMSAKALIERQVGTTDLLLHTWLPVVWTTTG